MTSNSNTNPHGMQPVNSSNPFAAQSNPGQSGSAQSGSGQGAPDQGNYPHPNYAQPQYMYPMMTRYDSPGRYEKEKSSIPLVLLGVLLTLVVLVAILLMVFVFNPDSRRQSNDSATHSVESNENTQSNTGGGQKKTGQKQKQQQQQQTSPDDFADEGIRDSANSGSPGASANYRHYSHNGVTSPEFAANVYRHWRSHYANTGSKSGSIRVYSPVTGQNYIMDCVPSGTAIRCMGGDNALVSIY